MSESIKVYYGPHIGGDNAPGYHKYIIYTNSAGERFYARGGPGAFGPGAVDGASHAPGVLGPIRTEHGPEFAYSPDFDADDNNPSETIIEGNDLSNDWGNITDAMDRLNEQNLPYQVLERNSNTAVDFALREAGLPEPQ